MAKPTPKTKATKATKATKPAAKKTTKAPKPTSASEPEAAPSFADVQRALTKALGKPKKSGAILRYKAPKDAAAWIEQVHAAGGVAALSEAYPARELCVVDGPPSALMPLVTDVGWGMKSTIAALDMLHAEAHVTISNINYTGFVLTLARAPKDPAAHAKRFAKVYPYHRTQTEAFIKASLAKRRWKT